MKAIETRVLPATLTKPTRLLAEDSDGNRVVITTDASTYSQHLSVAQQLCDKMGWKGADSLHGGATKAGYAFVFLDDGAPIQNWRVKSAGGHDLNVFYNRENNLLVVDLSHSVHAGGNEIVRKTLDEKALLSHCAKLPKWEDA